MRRSFSLIDEAWIPIIDIGYVSLRTIFENPTLKGLGGTVLEKIALTKFLLAIAQAAITPKNNEEAHSIGVVGMTRSVIEYLNRWSARFNLYGDTPFLQFPQINLIALQNYGSLLPYVATGNTTCLTQYHIEKKTDDVQRALLLIVQMSLALGGKKTDNSLSLSVDYQGKFNAKGNPTSSKPGPALDYIGLSHSFVLGSCLQETIWLNLLTEQDITTMAIFSEGLGRAPWEEMPIGEDCVRARHLKNSLLGRLIPLCRFCLLTDVGIHITEGIQHLNYKESIFDPSITLRVKREVASVVWCDPLKQIWRNLPAILGGIVGQPQYGQCHQLNIAYARAKSINKTLTIWSAGIKVSSNAGEQYLSGNDDVVESTLLFSMQALSSPDWFVCLLQALSQLEVLANNLFASVKEYFQQLKGDGIDLAQRATHYFWQLCDLDIADLLAYCQQPSQMLQLKEGYINYLQQCYTNVCPNQTARQLKVWVRCYPVLDTTRFNGEGADE